MFSITLIASIATALVCTLITCTHDYHIARTGDSASDSEQKFHPQTVSRVGGVAIFTGLFVGSFALLNAKQALATELFIIFACLLPVFVAGLAEDVTKTISPSSRYIAAALSALLITSITGLRITSLDIWGLDTLIAIPLVGSLFFVFAVAGVSHAFNLIDGQNGLCSGITTIICIAIMWQAAQLEQQTPFALAALCAASNLGFLLFNYPLGKIFLGDAGAYLNGALIAVVTVELVQAGNNLSPWYAVLLLIYPIWETVFSMWRRIIDGKPFSEPDFKHLHSLYYKAIASKTDLWRQSSAPVLWLLCATFCAASNFVAESTALCISLVLMFCAVYVALYRHALVITGEKR